MGKDGEPHKGRRLDSDHTDERAFPACHQHMVSGKSHYPHLRKWPRFCRTYPFPYGLAGVALEESVSSSGVA